LISIKTEASVLPSPKFENRLALNVSRYSYAISQVGTTISDDAIETEIIKSHLKIEIIEFHTFK
jgi:hypothetical protein